MGGDDGGGGTDSPDDVAWADLRVVPPNLVRNEFQERPSGASGMQENLLPGSCSALQMPWLSRLQEPHSRFRLFDYCACRPRVKVVGRGVTKYSYIRGPRIFFQQGPAWSKSGPTTACVCVCVFMQS